jgi:hypothetical protein
MVWPCSLEVVILAFRSEEHGYARGVRVYRDDPIWPDTGFQALDVGPIRRNDAEILRVISANAG